MYYLRRAVCLAVFVGLFILFAAVVPQALNPLQPTPEEKSRDERWVTSSPYWVDRQACRWVGLCGIHHLRWDAPALPGDKDKYYNNMRPLELRSLSQDHDLQKAWEVARGLEHTDERPRASGGSSGGQLQGVPDYVLRHAPLVHLYSGENFWPVDIAEHIRHMTAVVNGTRSNASDPLSLANLHKLDLAGRAFLTSVDDVEDRPEWLHSHGGIPGLLSAASHDAENLLGDDELPSTSSSSARGSAPHLSAARAVRDKLLRRERTRQRASRRPREIPDGKPDASGYSESPAVLVMVDKGSGILDAFWFFFYSYNLGQTVLDIRFGNHVGDWEHCMVRFEHGQPRAMFLSEHEGGQAYAWAALEKKAVETRDSEGNILRTERPVIYSAVGSHAMYAFPGDHPYVLPFKLLKDQTDRGPLWDPSLNRYAYFYDHAAAPPVDDDSTDERSAEEWSPYPFNASSLERVVRLRDVEPEPGSLMPAASNPDAPTSWFHFEGTWGDELYGLGDVRQWRLFGQYHYVTGPLGPKFKHLGREKVCQTDHCRILQSLEEGKKKSWYS